MLSEQFNEIYKRDIRVTNKLSVIIIQNNGESQEVTTASLRQQFNQNFEVYIFNPGTPKGPELANHWNDSSSMNVVNYPKPGNGLKNVIDESSGEYILFLKAGDTLFPEGLLYFAREASTSNADIIYSDERLSSENYDLKPDFSIVSFLNHLFIGRSILWKRKAIENLVGQMECSDFDCLMIELFLTVFPPENKIKHIDQVLLHKYLDTSDEISNSASLLIVNKVLQQRLIRLSLCNDAFAYFDGIHFQTIFKNPFKLTDMRIVIISYDKERTLHLIKQLRSIISNAKITVVTISGSKGISSEVSEEHSVQFCGNDNFSHAFSDICKSTSRKILAVISDHIGFVDSISIERMLNCFILPSVHGVSPKIALTDEKLIYAGTALFNYDSLSLDSTCNQYIDFVYETSHLSKDMFMIRTDFIKQVLPLDQSISNEYETIAELSMIINKTGGDTVYCGRSLALAVCEQPEEIVQLHTKGCFVRWLQEYRELFKKDKKERQYTYLMQQQTAHQARWECGIHCGDTDKQVRPSPTNKILIVSHELTLTGAPIVLQQAIRVLIQNGYWVTVISPCDGPMAEHFVSEGATVLIDSRILEPGCQPWFVQDYDLVVVNTIVPFRFIDDMKNYNIPVLWWIHDALEGYGYLDPVLMENVADNVHVYCGGEYAKWVLQKYRPKIQAEVLLYGFDDYSKDKIEEHYELPETTGKIIFANIGTICERKGQDVLAEAIGLLPKGIREKCYFLFVGRPFSENLYLSVINARDKYPDSVGFIEQLSRKQLNSVYNQVDCLICSSRDDPMPAFITEGMMFSKICICSEFTGTASLIDDGVNGFTYLRNDPVELAEKIRYVAENHDNLSSVRDRSRLLFEKVFRMDVFQDNLIKIVKKLSK